MEQVLNTNAAHEYIQLPFVNNIRAIGMWVYFEVNQDQYSWDCKQGAPHTCINLCSSHASRARSLSRLASPYAQLHRLLCCCSPRALR